MKLIPYELNVLENLDMNIFINHYDPLREKLDEIYGKSHLKFQGFDEIMKLGNPKRKIILDLGCGSIKSLDHYFFDRIFEPWLARGLHELGAKVIGIDMAPLNKEKFEGYNINLAKENSLSFLPNNSIDIAIASSFFDSPALNKKYADGNKTFKLLLPQLERVVKSKGHFIFDRICSGY